LLLRDSPAQDSISDKENLKRSHQMNETPKLSQLKSIYREKLQELPLAPAEIDLLMASKALAFVMNNFNLTADSPLFDPKARVDEVVSAFDKHGLTQTAYLQAIKKQPVLLNVAPRKIIDNINSVVAGFHHYGLTLENYIPALVKQPPLFYLPAETVIKNISAVVEHYQSAGISLTTYIKLDRQVLFLISAIQELMTQFYLFFTTITLSN
jgi:hypothetical protein